jgi:hypothetical protein
MRPIYISATIQDSGKTCVSLGLMQILEEKKANPGYIKPVGQHYIRYKNDNIDEDAVLIHQVFNLNEKPHCLSPIAIERGFTKKFIENPDVKPLEEDIKNCVQTLKNIHPLLIVEGTGHAGVGSCFGLSNARVAELIDASAVIVTAGGIGKPLDEVALNLALFRKHNVKILGVILNKVLPEKLEKVKATVSKGLELMDTTLLGAIPFEPTLTHFTMGQLAEAFGYEIICGHDCLSNRIENTVIAAMEPQNILQHIRDKTLVITPGDRIDNMLASMIVLANSYTHHGGLILTGGFSIDPKIEKLLQASNIPVLVSDADTFTVSSRMKGLGFKVCSYDTDKIAKLKTLIGKYVYTDKILQQLED